MSREHFTRDLIFRFEQEITSLIKSSSISEAVGTFKKPSLNKYDIIKTSAAETLTLGCYIGVRRPLSSIRQSFCLFYLFHHGLDAF